MGNIQPLHGSDVVPSPLKESVFDPEFGFSNGRKKREMIATEEEMNSAKLPMKDRDYCAHILLKYRACRADVFPFLTKCAHEKHEYLTCEYEDWMVHHRIEGLAPPNVSLTIGCDKLSKHIDTVSHSYVLRMKEFERERRLLQRKKRIEAKLH